MKSDGKRGADFDWYAQQDMSAYEGKYVAIVGRQVAASGKNLKRVYAQARRKFPGWEVMVGKIPKGDMIF